MLLQSSDQSDPARAKAAPNLRTELRLTSALGGPLALGEIGWMSTYIVDALMIGRLHDSAMPIAASSLGNTIFYAIVFCAIYLLNGLETLIAQAFGRGEDQECVYLLVQSFWIVLIATPVVMLATMGMIALLPHFGTPAPLVAEAQRYTRVLIWSTAPLMAYMALRRFLQSINRVGLITASLITGSPVNFLFDWVFMFGHFGASAMGLPGSGLSTCVVRLYMLALLIVGTAVAMRRTGLRFERRMLQPNGPRMRALLAIGWPSGLENLENLGVSTCGSILCARLGTTLAAANQVVLDLNAFVYQAAAGLSYATIVRVGQAAGRNNLPQVRRATRASLLLGLGFMTVAATLFAAFSHFWASLYTNSGAVVNAAAPIFFACAFGLIGDTLFVLMSSAFTGIGDTRSPLYVDLVWNWGLGIPLGYALCFRFGYSLWGLWVGRVISSLGSGISLYLLWRYRISRESRSVGATRLNLLGSFQASK